MTDHERLDIARDIIHSDMASAFEDVLLKRSEGFLVSKGMLDMALVLDRLYKLLHSSPKCPHPQWDEESAPCHGRCPCGDILSMLDDGHGDKRRCCYRCQEVPANCACPKGRWDYDMGKLKDLSEEICGSDPCPGPNCAKAPAGRCFSWHEKSNPKPEG